MSTRRTSTGDAPLLAWGEAMRLARHRRTTRRIVMGMALAIAALGVPVLCSPAPRLVWNASASVPVGLYRVIPGATARVGDMVVARVPEPWRGLAAERRYIPVNVPLVKRVAAAAGQEACARGRIVFVDRKLVVTRRPTDPHGRILPWWDGCIRLRGRQLFLLTDAPESFDGRYFGISEDGDVIGRAVLLWRR
ncbi:S26 family signal peptidase [Sphingomonas sp.]|uniref:S26 family signal peptidase n=1 Tax=Sphingomonas sp. TaxID=28214 RepID=UPI003D6CBB0A